MATSGDRVSIQIGRPTLRQLQAMLPNAAVETSNGGEVTLWTGWAVDPKNPDGPLVDWCDECDSGAAVPAGGCSSCGCESV